MKQGKKYTLSPYPFWVRVFTDAEAYAEYTGQPPDKDAVGESSADEASYVMYLGPQANPGVVAHECIHICVWCLGTVGIDVRESNAEALTYLVEHLMTRILKDHPEILLRKEPK